MGLIELAASGLRLATHAVERLEHPHGPWCDGSKNFVPDSPDSTVVPIRVGDEFVGKMLTDDGWAADISAVMIRPSGDGTFQMFFREADAVDLSSNRNVQRMVMTALDLVQSLDMSNCDLPEEAIEALSEFKKAARSRLGGGIV